MEVENEKVAEDQHNIQLDIAGEVQNNAILHQQNGQVIVLLGSEHSNTDLDQIRRAIIDVNRVSGQLVNDVAGASEAEQLVPVTFTNGLPVYTTVTQTPDAHGGLSGSDATGNTGELDQLSCGKCKETFNDVMAFLEHGAQHMNAATSFPCGLCSVKSKRLAALKQHYRNKHGINNFLQASQKSAPPTSNRRRGPRKTRQSSVEDKTPEIVETPVGNEVSSAANGSHKSSVLLSVNNTPNHDFAFVLCTNENNDITSLKCLECDSLVAEKMEMVNHMKTFHADKMGVTQLETSGATERPANEHEMLMSKFIELTSMKSIRKKATCRDKQDKSGVFTCNKCGKVFGRIRNLRRHLETHKTEKTYLCADCGRGFASSTYLSLHRKTHRQKVFQCTQCEFTSSSNPAIHAHRQIHSQGSVLCDQCGYAYNDRSTLLKHKEVHNLSRPYACSFPSCTWRFKTEVMCRAHIKAHTTEGKFKCSFCGYIFRHKHHLQRHESKIHGVEHSKQNNTTKSMTTEMPISMETEVDQLQLQLHQPQQIVVTTDNQGTPITYEASDISGLTYQTLLHTQENQGQETCAIFVDSSDGGHIVFQNE